LLLLGGFAAAFGNEKHDEGQEKDSHHQFVERRIVNMFCNIELGDFLSPKVLPFSHHDTLAFFQFLLWEHWLLGVWVVKMFAHDGNFSDSVKMQRFIRIASCHWLMHFQEKRHLMSQF